MERVKIMMYEQKGIINNLKRNQKEILESKSNMKYSLEGFKDTCQQAEESTNLRVRQWKLRSLRNSNKKRLSKSERSASDLQDTTRGTNICLRIPQFEYRK